MNNKFKIDGIWIPYQILTDKNLRDKEKIIYSLIQFFSNNKEYIYIEPRNKSEERKLYPLVRINEPIQKVPFKGLFIPIKVLTDNNINDKEKFIYTIALYYGNVEKQCTLNNGNLEEIFGVTKNQISRIVNRLSKKGYTKNKYVYKNVNKEILYREISTIRKNDDTYRKKVQYRYNQKVQQDMEEKGKVLIKKEKNNYKIKNNTRNYEGRKYPKGFLESLYANGNFHTL